ncbi:MAG: EcsC family protein, partial [Parvimonas micra]
IGKLIPVVGAAVSGSLDYAETKVIASRSYKWFFEGDFDSDVKTEVYDDIDIDDEMEFEVID